MIQLPKRSVTRFFIPLIDVLTLLFCIFLLMPMVKSGSEAATGSPEPMITPFTAEERQELRGLGGSGAEAAGVRPVGGRRAGGEPAERRPAR